MHKYRRLLILGLVLLCSLSFTAVVVFAALPYNSKITGSVMDKQGNPLANIYVSVEPVNHMISIAFGQTDGNGVYQFTHLSSGAYKVMFADASRPRHYATAYYAHALTATDATVITLEQGATLAGINVQLPLATGRIIGRVTDNKHNPVDNLLVTVQAVNPSAVSLPTDYVTTDANGVYQIEGLMQGDYKVEFNDLNFPRRYGAQFYPAALTLADATIINVSEGATITGIDAKVAPANARIRGRVTDPNGQPVAQASVDAYAMPNEAFANSAETDGDGNYTIDGLGAGIYRISVSVFSPHYLVIYYPNAPTFAVASDIRVKQGAKVDNINVQFQNPLGQLRGNVADQRGQLFSSVNIFVYEDFDGDNQWSFYTSANADASGVYTVTNLRDGAYRLGFSLPYSSYGSHSCASSNHIAGFYENATNLATAKSVFVVGGKPTTGINVQLPPINHIHGKVTDPAGQPLRYALVQALDVHSYFDCYATGTSEDGSYTIDLPAGVYHVRFWGGSPGPGSPRPISFKYYQDVYTFEEATNLSVEDGRTLPDINAQIRSDDGLVLTAVADHVLVAQSAITRTLVTSKSVLDNDYDPERDELTALLVTPPAHGTLILDAAGLLTYTLTTAPFISDTFTYQASDGVHQSNVVTVTLLPVNAKVALPVINR